jgi:hypothetical protein
VPTILDPERGVNQSMRRQMQEDVFNDEQIDEAYSGEVPVVIV